MKGYANYLSRDSYVNKGDTLVTKMFPYIQAFRKYIIYGGSQLINHKGIVRLKRSDSYLGTLISLPNLASLSNGVVISAPPVVGVLSTQPRSTPPLSAHFTAIIIKMDLEG